MKVLGWIVGVIMAVAMVVFGLQIFASESGEVVVLHTEDAGRDAKTRLWVVDYQDRQWLRSGAGAGSAWLERLIAEPRVELERAGQRRAYRAEVEPGMGPHINQLMAEKYGWRDRVVAVLVGGRDAVVAVRLVPAQ